MNSQNHNNFDYKKKIKSRETYNEYSIKNNNELSEKSSTTSESTLYNTTSIYSLNEENQNELKRNDIKYASKSNRPTSSLSYSRNNEMISKPINNSLKLKPNPLANSVDPTIIQYNSNLINYTKLLSNSMPSKNNNNYNSNRNNSDNIKKSHQYYDVNDTIRKDIDAFIKTKNNIEKKIMN